jgi:hypothetical protein
MNQEFLLSIPVCATAGKGRIRGKTEKGRKSWKDPKKRAFANEAQQMHKENPKEMERSA